jgi:dephospho-CoA kinase
VARLLAERGARIVDADQLVHQAYAPATPGFDAVVEAFGPEIVAPDGRIDRARLGSAVFSDAEQMKRLTDIVWPLARELAEAIKRESEQQDVAVLVIEAPLLIEAGWRDLVDQVWFVRAPEHATRERLARLRHLGPEAIEARLTARKQSLAQEAGAADQIIENDGDLSALARRVDDAWLTLRSRGLV